MMDPQARRRFLAAIDELRGLSACPDAQDWLISLHTPDPWRDCPWPGWLVWYLMRTGRCSREFVLNLVLQHDHWLADEERQSVRRVAAAYYAGTRIEKGPQPYIGPEIAYWLATFLAGDFPRHRDIPEARHEANYADDIVGALQRLGPENATQELQRWVRLRYPRIEVTL